MQPRRPKSADSGVNRPVPRKKSIVREPAAEPIDDASGSSAGGAAVAAVISLLVIVAVIGVAAFVILRTRLAPRLRARLTHTPYDDIRGRNRSESQQNVIA